jgi:hypothetical protein
MVVMKMKRAIVPIFVVFLTCGVAAAVTRLLMPPAKAISVPIVQKTNIVNYKGVSFAFDHSLAPEIKSETIPAMTDGKPADIHPEHPAFTLMGYPRPRGLSESDAEIRVFPVIKFREAVRIASDRDARNVVFPKNPTSWTVYFDEEVRVLKSLLASKPSQANISRFLAKARGTPGCSAAMPFLPMWEACQAFVAHVRYINFKNGSGVFFLTQWDVGETTQISNEGLEYAYQGISNDGQYYVYAEFSVAAPFLPKGDEPDVADWNQKNYLLPHRSKRYQNYLGPIFTKLEALPASEFQPNLELLEQLIQSLEVEDKQSR